MQNTASLPAKDENSVSSILYRVFIGFVFGFANIIPGVSGGTAMVVFGVYERIIAIITDFKHKIKTEWKFFLPILLGMGAAILLFGILMSDLLEKYNAFMQMFFMGVIVFSLPQIFKYACYNDAKKLNIKPAHVIAFLLVLALMVFMAWEDGRQNDKEAAGAKQAAEETALSSDEWKVGKIAPVTVVANKKVIDEEAAKNDPEAEPVILYEEGQVIVNEGDVVDEKQIAALAKIGLLNESVPTDETEDKKSDGSGDYNPDHSVGRLLMLVVYGAVASSTMIIPGISGSLVMVLLGQYEAVVGAVKHIDILTLLPFGVGCLIGIIFCAKLIRWLLKKHSQLMYSAILGFVLGSILTVFPGWNYVVPVIAFLIGAACIVGCELLGRKFNPIDKRM